MATRLDILDELVADGHAAFTSGLVRDRLGLSPQATSNLLAQWVREGLVDRVSRGRYAVRQLGALGTRAASEDVSLAVAAGFANVPHRIAYRSALDYHGMLTHPARTIQVASPVDRRTKSISGRKLRIVSEPESTIAIASERTPHGAIVSNPMRALLEAAARPDLVGGPAVLAEGLLSRAFDAAELTGLARQLDAGAALRRLGSIADQLDVPGLAGVLEPLAPPKSDTDLDTRDPRRAFRDSRWHVAWPITPDELKTDVHQ